MTKLCSNFASILVSPKPFPGFRLAVVAAMAILVGAGLGGCAMQDPDSSLPLTIADSSGGMAPDPGLLIRLDDTQQAFVDNVQDRVFFGFDRHVLTEDAMTILSRQADWLVMHPDVDILIAGNADPRGSEEYNIRLGRRRAVAAADFLIRHGVDQSRLLTISYGKNRPVADGKAGWPLDRNAITSIEGGGNDQGDANPQAGYAIPYMR